MLSPSISSPRSSRGASIKKNKTKMGRLQNPPSFIVKDNCRFLIMDAPTDYNLNVYIECLKDHKIQTLVRTCEPTYASDQLDKAGIKVIDLRFCDGEPPSHHVINQWLNIVHDENIIHNRPVAIHCVAGLGRSPLLAAIALIEFADMEPIESVELIRKTRKGAIDQKQLNYLKNYKSQRRERGCIIL